MLKSFITKVGPTGLNWRLLDAEIGKWGRQRLSVRHLRTWEAKNTWVSHEMHEIWQVWNCIIGKQKKLPLAAGKKFILARNLSDYFRFPLASIHFLFPLSADFPFFRFSVTWKWHFPVSAQVFFPAFRHFFFVFPVFRDFFSAFPAFRHIVLYCT